MLRHTLFFKWARNVVPLSKTLLAPCTQFETLSRLDPVLIALQLLTIIRLFDGLFEVAQWVGLSHINISSF